MIEYFYYLIHENLVSDLISVYEVKLDLLMLGMILSQVKMSHSLLKISI